MRAITLLFHDVYRDTPEESGFSSEAAHRYKLPTAAFEAHVAGIVAVRNDRPFVANELPITTPRAIDRSSAPGVVLPYLITFDDGGVSFYTDAADRLEEHGWRGHCFVTTDMIGRSGFLTRAQLEELDRRGHVIGTHSASHPRRFSALTLEEMRKEWTVSRKTLEDLLGHSVHMASVPGGYFSRDVAVTAAETGIRTLFTSEPVTSTDTANGCLILGRFTIRHDDPADLAQRLVMSSSWARSRAWIEWNAKGLLKPVLGDSYVRVTHWLAARRALHRPPAASANAS